MSSIFGDGPSESTTDFPEASWPVTIRRGTFIGGQPTGARFVLQSAASRALRRIQRATRLARVGGPTTGQIESYRREGFLIVERFLEAADLDRVVERFMRVFEHEWETGLAPDEVNYVPGVTAPELPRQLRNVWKADRAGA